MADDVLQSLWIAIGFKADDGSRKVAEKSVQDYQDAVVRAEKVIEDARWAGTKTEEEVAKLTRETNLRLAKEALQKAKDEEARRVKADRDQQAAIKAGKERVGDFLKVVVGVATAIEAAALGVHAGVVRMAQSFDALQFTSQRTSTTVRSIQAIGYAASQMGSSVEGGISSFESFARKLQEPGYYELLERLGIKTRDVMGKRVEADKLYHDFGKKLGEKPIFLQRDYLNDFGITDEKAGRALINGMEGFEKEYNEKLKRTGLDPDKAAKDAAALQRTFGSLGASLDIIGQKVASRLFDGENNAFQKFIGWLDDHGDQIAEVMSRIAQVVLELAKALLELITSPEAKKWFETMLSAFGDFDKETGKFTANVDKMKVALGLLGAYVATDWIKKILGAFGLLGAGWAGLLRTFGIPIAIGAAATGHGYQTPEEYQDSLKTDPEAKAFDDERKAQGGGLGRLLKRGYNAVRRALGGGSAEAHTNGGEAAALDGSYTGNDGRRAARGRLSAAGAQRVASWMEFLQRPVAEGGEGMPQGKAMAMIATMQGESGLNLDPGGPDGDSGHAHGTAQWSDANGNPRFPLLKKYAASQGKDWRDMQIQQQYHRMEMLGLPGAVSHNHAYRAIMAAPSDNQALYEAIAKFENPQKHDLAYQIRKPFLDRLQRGDAVAAAPAAPVTPAPKPVSVRDVLPNGLPPVFQSGNVPAFAMPTAPSMSTSDYSRTNNITIKQGDLTVNGGQEPRQISEIFKSAQGYHTSDTIRNLRPILT